ncbi:hypothetical protein PR202_ga12239 [Eleusine coracana subsp. coracana]|uniref:Acyl-CoA-binding domain-containing protein n=1 Tax=Eleusine coracana subsp. coracana TaxID=191504 RepID=A0AAV5CB36_ELECO|nr:hypothetical protein PR202_ga12239 [Eleusine coracana subsp. coracana]
MAAVKGPVLIGSPGPVAIASEESKAVVAENGKMVDVLDKVSMEAWSCCTSAKMYIFGGNNNGRYLGDIQVLNFKSLSWSKLEARSQPRTSESTETDSIATCAGHSLISVGSKILCLAGHTREPTECLSVKEFDPETCTWSTSSRGGQSVTRVGDTLVVFGGEGDGRTLLNDLHILDLETMTWDEFETMGTPPSPRSDHAAACYTERYLLIFGGGSHSTCFGDLHLLDMQTMEWSRPRQQGITPEPRAGHAGVTVGEYWFITGGGNNKKEASLPQGSSLVQHTLNGEEFLVSFGGYSGRYSNEVYALKPSVRPIAPSQQINEPETNGTAPISVAASSSGKVIFEIEELQDEHRINGTDISRSLLQTVKVERDEIEDRLNQERLQRLQLKQELDDVEGRNVELELDLVRDQLSAEGARVSKLENEISELQQRLQKMNALEYEFESLRHEIDNGSEEAASGGNQSTRGGGFWRWNE